MQRQLRTALYNAHRVASSGTNRLVSTVVGNGGLQREVTVWFDSQCPLCIREITLFRGLDRLQKIDFIDLASPSLTFPSSVSPSSSSSTSPNCPTTKSALLSRFHAQARNGPLVSGAAAFAKMWQVLPRDTLLGRTLGNLGKRAEGSERLMWALEKAYVGFLVVRPGMQWIARGVTGEGKK